MIRHKSLLSTLLSLMLAIFTVVAPFARQIAAQQPAAAPAASSTPDQAAGLAAIEKAIDDRRKELGIPGVSLVIVKNDQVIYMKGLGVKDFEKKLPVTPDTLFAIGSASKAFTALAAVMAAGKGKLSLEDSPKKYLPYFKMRDADSDAKITIRDLLSHRSGLNRTDLAMVTGKLNRAELIQVAASAKPTAKLGEKFQYQNIMYAAAGEIVAKVDNSTWDKVMMNEIFKPLGMNASNTTAAAMQKTKDFSYGYEYNATTKETRKLPQREIVAAAPAGAINSNARDMAQWLRFMLGGGSIDGKRLVSEKNFNELVTKQMNVGGSIDYGLGWFLRDWNGHKFVEHGGNIDGFNSQVAFMPDQKLGFVLLTNVTASPLVNFAMNNVWTNLVAGPSSSSETAKASAADPKLEVGTYTLVEANMNFDVAMKDGKLVLTVPGQPPYPLENIGGRRYKLAEPAPPGFFATFRPAKGKETESELFLEQPQGNVVLVKAAAVAAEPKDESQYNGPLQDLIGFYEEAQSKRALEIAFREGNVSLLIPGQQVFPLVEKEKNKVISTVLPDTYWIGVNRDEGGHVTSLVFNQPEGKFTFNRVAEARSLISTDELLAKMIAAYGGEENLRKHKTSLTTIEVDLENQGVLAEGSVSSKAPNMQATSMKLTALGKEIGSIVTYFNGAAGGQTASFAPEETFSGKRLTDVKVASDFYDVLNWKQNFKTITVKRIAKVGDEDAYVVEKAPENGHPMTDYISTKSFLLLRRESVIASETSNVELPQTELFSDYRKVDGVMIAFKTVSNNVAYGDIVTRVKDVQFNVDLPDSIFTKPVKKN
jgi:CubicO group peptidase (beta-lactamase class C family)